MRLIDLSLPLHTGMPVYPGDPEPVISLIHTIERNGWELRRLEINAHDGTHVNVPSHMIVGAKCLDEYVLADFCGPARIYAPELAMSAAEGVIFADCNIEAALAECNGRVSGARGAAVRLGIPQSTLDSKIKALKINKYRFRKS